MKAIALGLALLAAHCGAALAQEDTAITVIGPMTGPYTRFGEQMKAGAAQAINDINKSGGVNGRQLRLIFDDDACDPKQAAAIAGRLVNLSVKMVAGHFCSGASVAAAKIYAAASVVQISPASTNPRFTDERAGPGVFRVSGRDDRQGAVTGAYLADKFKDRKVAILHDRTVFGKGLADETRKAMNRIGLKEVLYEAFAAGEKDYATLVAKLKQAAIDVVYVGGFHTEAGLIVREMRAQGMASQFVGGEALATPEFWQIAGAAAEGTLMAFWPDPRRSQAASQLVKALAARQVEPERTVLYTYAAVQVWAQAANAAGSDDAKAVTAKLNELEFKTVLGSFTFDNKGDPSLPPFTLYEWKAGTYRQVDD